MLKEFLSIFRGDSPVSAMGQDFFRMIDLALNNTLTAGEILVRGNATPSERSAIYEQDIEINKLQRKIRKRVVAHLSLKENSFDVPYCLLLVSLIKDVERLGDYAKNISEIIDLRPGALPEDEVVQELWQIKHAVEEAFSAAPEIFDTSDRERALNFISAGRDIAHRCDALISQNSRGEHDAGTTTAIVLATRFYKRIGGHVLNVLSSVVMPLHKVDYYDEEEVTNPNGSPPAESEKS